MRPFSNLVFVKTIREPEEEKVGGLGYMPRWLSKQKQTVSRKTAQQGPRPLFDPQIKTYSKRVVQHTLSFRNLGERSIRSMA